MKNLLRSTFLALALVSSAGAGFEGPLALTPPDPGEYFLNGPFARSFGEWRAVPTAGSITVDTRFAPTNLVLSVAASRPMGGYFFRQALTAGEVSFKVQVEGSGSGTLSWFRGEDIYDPGAVQGVLTNLTDGFQEVRFQVASNEFYGFRISASGESGGRRATIGDFSGPDRPAIRFNLQPASYRAGSRQEVTLTTEAQALNLAESVTLQWHRDGAAIPGATNSTLTVIAGPPGTTQRYQVVAKAGEVEAASQIAEVVAVGPSGARAVLHLDFEERAAGHFVDTAGNEVSVVGEVPLVAGRLGLHAAQLAGTGYLRVAAAGTDLDLAGRSYTIAWWFNPGPDQNGQIFTVGNPGQNMTGFGARLVNGALALEHRNGKSQPLQAALHSGWQHVAVVYNRFDRAAYVNGALAGSVETSGDILGSFQDDLFIGAGESNSPAATGAIDDLTIYNYPLTAEEIGALFNQMQDPPALRIRAAGGQVVLQWPASAGARYRIEYTAALGEAMQWLPANEPIHEANGQHESILETPPHQRYYRLRKL